MMHDEGHEKRFRHPDNPVNPVMDEPPAGLSPVIIRTGLFLLGGLGMLLLGSAVQPRFKSSKV